MPMNKRLAAATKAGLQAIQSAKATANAKL